MLNCSGNKRESINNTVYTGRVFCWDVLHGQYLSHCVIAILVPDTLWVSQFNVIPNDNGFCNYSRCRRVSNTNWDHFLRLTPKWTTLPAADRFPLTQRLYTEWRYSRKYCARETLYTSLKPEIRNVKTFRLQLEKTTMMKQNSESFIKFDNQSPNHH